MKIFDAVVYIELTIPLCKDSNRLSLLRRFFLSLYFYRSLNSIATSDKIFSNIEIFVEILSGFEERIDIRAQERTIEVIDWLKR